MSKPAATAIFAGPYGGETREHIRPSRRGGQTVFAAKPPGYVAKVWTSVEHAKAYMARAHNFVRWEA